MPKTKVYIKLHVPWKEITDFLVYIKLGNFIHSSNIYRYKAIHVTIKSGVKILLECFLLILVTKIWETTELNGDEAENKRTLHTKRFQIRIDKKQKIKIIPVEELFKLILLSLLKRRSIQSR